MAAIYGDAWHERTCSLTRQPAGFFACACFLSALSGVLSAMKRYCCFVVLDDMEAVQEEIQASSTPRHVSRIPSKIASRFAYLTAAEWKSLGALFASTPLRDRLVDSRKYDLVCKLQKVWFLLECRALTTDQVDQIHALFLASVSWMNESTERRSCA